MQVEYTTKDISDALKGMAIVIVMVNHYINIYLSNFFAGHANGVIALFFILSGYGMFIVFERNAELNASVITGILVQRFIRIFPLFWISMFVLQMLNLKILFWIDYIVPNYKIFIVYWYINALIQCYLAAPLLYAGLKKIGTTGFVLALIGLVLLINLSPFSADLTNEPLFLKYRFLLFLHLLLFATGLSLPSIIRAGRQKLKNSRSFLLPLIAFLVMVVLTRKKEILFPYSTITLGLAFYLSASCFCLIIVLKNPSFWSKNFFAHIGAYSYTLFLFHMIYFALVGKLVTFFNIPGWHLAITLVLSPLFFLICVYLEKMNRVLALAVKNCFKKSLVLSG